MARVSDYSLRKIFFCKPRIVTHENQGGQALAPHRERSRDPCIEPHDNHTRFFTTKIEGY